MVYTPALVFGHGLHIGTMSEEDSFIELMRKFLYQFTSSDKKDVRRGSLESCEFVKERSSSIDSETSLDYEERLFLQDMTRQIELCLSDAKETSLRCQMLLLPRSLTTKVARDVVRSSAGEPCGIRGAFIKVFLETTPGLQLQMLGTVSPDPTVTPTFELSIVFKLDKEGWPPIFVTHKKVLKLQPQYRLVKKKLYSSASPVILEFS
ncbi:DNA damage-inducible transcript 4-like protein [Esox lucius]|uniref:DNA damage-inducible transcript 4-like protein n=1 Tax=Esox lucius TaxID=8010 RepID=A0AAY5K1Y9_ESOLU|nr:DNA damage-inducible transcript 4-like protein [Esox lucius]